MSVALAALAAGLQLVASDSPSEQSSNPVASFLHAADDNDFSTMKSMSDGNSSKFLKEIANCYLRRVYEDTQLHRLVAAWMCAESPTRSRVVLANISLAPNKKVVVTLVSDTTADRPAPERTGSALAP